MDGEVFYVRVSGAWEGSPAIYIGPFPSYGMAERAVHDGGGTLEPRAEDPGAFTLLHRDHMKAAEAPMHEVERFVAETIIPLQSY